MARDAFRQSLTDLGFGDDLAAFFLQRRQRAARDKRRREGKRPDEPRAFEARLGRLTKRISERTSVVIWRELAPILARAQKRARQDAVDELTPEQIAILEAFFSAERVVRGVLRDTNFIAEVERIAGQLSLWNAEQVAESLSIPIDAVADVRALDLFRTETVDLIRSIPAKQLGRVQDLLRRASTTGMRVETLRNRIQEEFDVSRRRAELIARDQVLKANGELSRQRQRAAGVERYRWSTSQDSRVRPEHGRLNGREFRWDSPPATNKRGDRNHPGQDFQCLPGRAPIYRADGILRAFRRTWSGKKLARGITSKGLRFEATTNHPILTDRGWQPMHSLKIGDYVFAGGHQAFLGGAQDVEHVVPSIEEVFNAAALVGTFERIAGLASQFHGDGAVDHEVDVVCVDGILRFDPERLISQELAERLLSDADSAAPRPRDVAAMRLACGLASDGVMGRLGKCLALLLREASHASEHCLASAPASYALAIEHVRDRLPRDTVFLSKGLHATAGKIEALRLLARVMLGIGRGPIDSTGHAGHRQLLTDGLLVDSELLADSSEREALLSQPDRIVDLSFGDGRTAHVYNLETAGGWYASRVIMHNCRCVAIPILDD